MDAAMDKPLFNYPDPLRRPAERSTAWRIMLPCTFSYPDPSLVLEARKRLP